MGELTEMPSEDDKALSDKNRKKTLKTRSQIEALENFYDEHKYPTEALKLLAAKRIGLTEKQISSWFCHRRLKDKKILNKEVHVNGRQDRSSGIIQDLGSGPRQDSSTSTKQSDDRNQGPVEVQSRRVNAQEVLAADLTYEHGSQDTSNHSHMDDTSSGSSSSPRNMYCNGDPMHIVNSKLRTQSVANNVKGGKPKSGPSGYLKVKARAENATITAVKRQLGPLYREDGPPLGIEFDPLPQEVFESSSEHPANETFYDRGLVPHNRSDAVNIDHQYLSKPYHVKGGNPSPLEDVPRVQKQPISSTGYRYTSNLSLHESVQDGKSSKMNRQFEHSRSSFCQMPTQDFSLSNHTDIDMHGESAQEIPSYDGRNYNERSTMVGNGGYRMGGFSFSQQFQPRGVEVNLEQAELWSNHERRRKVGRGDRLHSSYSDMTFRQESDVFENQGLLRKAAKVNNFFGTRKTFDDDRDAVQRYISLNNQMHRANAENPPYVAKVLREAVPKQLNQITRSDAQTQSSEDDVQIRLPRRIRT